MITLTMHWQQWLYIAILTGSSFLSLSRWGDPKKPAKYGFLDILGPWLIFYVLYSGGFFRAIGLGVSP